MIKVLRNLLINLSPILRYEVLEESMMPFFKPGDIIFVNRFAYIFSDPKPYDIIVFRSPLDGKHLLKKIKKAGNKKYFVVGTNSTESVDSRSFGLISKDKIIGKVIL